MTSRRPPVPERGDLIWPDFHPQAGSEQAGRRPGLVVSPESYNRKAGLALLCPVTSRVKGYPFEVLLPDGLRISGAVLCDQVRSLDWRARNAERADRVPSFVMDEVTARILTLIDPDAG